MDHAPAGTIDTPEALSPSGLLALVERRLRASFPTPVQVAGRVVAVRENRAGFVTLTLADARPGGGGATRLEVSLAPRVAARTLPAARADQALVQVTGVVVLWQQQARVQLQASEVVRIGHSETEATYAAALAAIGAEGLGAVVPPLPLFLRRILLLAPQGTTLGDLTRDLGGWQPPTIVAVPLPGDSPDLGGLVAAAVAEVGEVDLVVLARGGSIERISGWDALALLRTVDRIQRAGRPVLVAVGHAEHNPLVYRVAGYRVRHTAEAGRWLADHNRTSATRIAGLAALPGVLQARLQARREQLGSVQRGLHATLTGRLQVRRERHASVAATLTRSVQRQVAAAADRAARLERQLPAALAARLADRQRRLDLVSATLDGFATGLALVRAADGGPARYAVGERLRLEVATATVLATIDDVEHHRSEGS